MACSGGKGLARISNAKQEAQLKILQVRHRVFAKRMRTQLLLTALERQHRCRVCVYFRKCTTIFEGHVSVGQGAKRGIIWTTLSRPLRASFADENRDIIPCTIPLPRFLLLNTAWNHDSTQNAAHSPDALQRDCHLDRLEVRDVRILVNLDNSLESRGKGNSCFWSQTELQPSMRNLIEQLERSVETKDIAGEGKMAPDLSPIVC